MELGASLRQKVLNDILPLVEKPGRYIGGEHNSVSKPWDSVSTRFLFAFPDVYDVGMSYLGLRVLYHLINQREDALCERASHLGLTWRLSCAPTASHSTR